MNFALSTLEAIPPSSIIVNSDADALLESNTIELIVKILADNSNIGVVGANIYPSRLAIRLEFQHWMQQNQLRMIESSLYSCSSVVAPCYGFRRNIIDRFPDDCVADDLYLAYFANSKGLLVKCLVEANGKETRAPQRHIDYIVHKFRKTNACLREAFRFLPFFNGYPFQWKIIYSVKVLQLILCPFIILVFILYSIFLLFSQYPLPVVVFIGWTLLIISMSATIRFLLTMTGLKDQDINKNIRGTPISLFINLSFMTLIIIASVISYPFYRQNSCYTKVSSR